MGWVSSAHGIRGEVFVRLYAKESDWHDEAESLSLLLNRASELKSFSIQKVQSHKDGLIVKFAEVRDRNQAETLAKSGVYVGDELLTADKGDGFYLKQIENFQLVDTAAAVLGQITGFGSNGPQDLLRVRTPEGKEALVPLVEAFLVDIDFDKQTVTMDLPPGLLTLED